MSVIGGPDHTDSAPVQSIEFYPAACPGEESCRTTSRPSGNESVTTDGRVVDHISDRSRITLFPTVVRRLSDDGYSVFRIGARNVTMIATSKAGVEVIRLFRRGKTVGQVKSIIGSRYASSSRSVNLDAVLIALSRAKFIRRIDALEIQKEPMLLTRVLAQQLGFVLIAIRQRILQICIRYASVPTSHKVCYLWKSLSKRSKWRHVEEEACATLQSVLGSNLSPRRIAQLAAAFRKERVRNEVDVEYLTQLPRPKLVRWLRQRVEFTGIERIERATAEGRGVVLCGLHFSSAPLLLPMFWLRGYSFIGAGTAPRLDLASVLTFNDHFTKRGVRNSGSVTWFTKFDLQGALAIVRTLQKGGTALVFADGYIDRSNLDMARQLGHSAMQYKAGETPVNFLGRTATANTGIPWIALQSQATIFPIKLLRQGETKFEVVIEPELDLTSTTSAPEVATELYRRLEKDIYLHPASWAYWNKLDNFTTIKSSD